jgi:hypothetical protein
MFGADQAGNQRIEFIVPIATMAALASASVLTSIRPQHLPQKSGQTPVLGFYTAWVKTGRNGVLIEAILAVDEMPSEMVHLVENNLRQIVGVRRLTVVLGKVTRPVASWKLRPNLS